MILTAHQPSYLPWLGLFAKILLADEFCSFDAVQYSKKGFDNRNRVLTQQGVRWLTVPVESGGHRQKTCREMRIASQGWALKHMKTLKQNYGQAPYFDFYAEELAGILCGRRYEWLADLNESILRWGMQKLEVVRPIVRASEFAFQGQSSKLVLDMCLELGASTYIFGGEGHRYADTRAFEEARIRTVFLRYNYPVYPQGGKTFVPNLSFVDLLFWCGPSSSRILRESVQALV